MNDPLLYHEKQIARDLDALERQFMQEGGIDTADYQKFLEEESGNVAADGMFSIQVLSKALEVWNLEVIPLDNPEVRSAREEPTSEQAFICNLEAHWFAVRKVGEQWWNFNSLFPAPQPLSSFYLSAFFDTLREQGYTIFLVRGAPPLQQHSAQAEGAGRWFTAQQAKDANDEAERARQQGRLANALENVMAKASTAGSMVGLRTAGAPLAQQGSPVSGDEDEDLAAAIAASLQDNPHAAGASDSGWGGEGTSGQVVPAVGGQQGGDAGFMMDDDDAELAAAIAASLQDVQAVPGSNSSGQAPPPQEPEAPELPEPGPEPEDGPGVCNLAVRLPGGGRSSRRFLESEPVKALYGWLRGQGVDVRTHVLCTQFPRKEVALSDASLQDVGLTGRQLLTIEHAPK